MKGLLLATVVLVACGAAAGCGSSGNKTDGGGGVGGGGGGTGGGSGSINCSSFTPCGGNIVGTWRYVSGCGMFSSETCPSESTMSTVASGGTATYTFTSGGVFTYMSSGNVNENIDYALGCISSVTDAGIPQACTDVQNFYRTTIGQDAGSVQVLSASCSATQNQTCNCALVFATQSGTMQGSYTISGNQVTITDADGGAGTPADYCVSGTTLTLHLGADAVAGNFLLTLTR